MLIKVNEKQAGKETRTRRRTQIDIQNTAHMPKNQHLISISPPPPCYFSKDRTSMIRWKTRNTNDIVAQIIQCNLITEKEERCDEYTYIALLNYVYHQFNSNHLPHTLGACLAFKKGCITTFYPSSQRVEKKIKGKTRAHVIIVIGMSILAGSNYHIMYILHYDLIRF